MELQRVANMECPVEPEVGGGESQFRHCLGPVRVHVDAIDAHRPGVRIGEAEHHVERGALAGTVWTYERDALTGCDREGNVVDCDVLAECLGNFVDGKQHWSPPSPLVVVVWMKLRECAGTRESVQPIFRCSHGVVTLRSTETGVAYWGLGLECLEIGPLLTCGALPS